MAEKDEQPDPLQGHPRQWPSTPYSNEARAPEPPPDQACCIALVGDCTVSCLRWPPANRPESHLAVRLRRAFPHQPFLVRNLSDEGATVQRASAARGEVLLIVRNCMPRGQTSNGP